MDRNRVYERTRNYVQGRWVSIVVILLIINLIDSLLGSILKGGTAFNLLTFKAIMDDPNPLASFLALTQVGARGFLTGVLKTFIALVMNGAFAITLLKSVMADVDIIPSEIVDNAREYMVPLAVSGFLTSILLTIIGIIPILGFIVSIVVGYALGFRVFLIGDGTTDNGVDSITQSFSATNGYKMQLFMLDVKYLGAPIAVFLGSLFIMLIFWSVPSLGVIFMLLGGLAAVLLLFYFGPYLLVAQIFVYLESKGM